MCHSPQIVLINFQNLVARFQSAVVCRRAIWIDFVDDDGAENGVRPADDRQSESFSFLVDLYQRLLPHLDGYRSLETEALFSDC